MRIIIANTKKGNIPSTSFIAKTKSLEDEVAAIGRPVSDLAMVDYILVGLDRDYNPMADVVRAIKNTITVDDLFSQITAFDQRMEMLGDSSSGGFHSSTNAVYRGRGQSRGKPHGRGGRGATVVIAVTAVIASPLLQTEEADSEDALDNNNNNRCVNNSTITRNVRYAIGTIQEAHVFAGGAMKRTIRKRRRRMLSPMA